MPRVPLLDGKYRIERVVGEGATGVVFEAVHVVLQRRCAVKLLRTVHSLSPDALVRFHREAEALGRLRHPNIVEVSDFGVDQDTGQPYLVMEYLDGITLGEWCRERRVPLEEALPILGSIARAIDYAHAQGILHRDLKPGNVVLCQTPQGRVAKVLDFGLARRLAAPAPQVGGMTHATDIDSAATTGLASRRGASDDAQLTEPGALMGTPYYVSPEAIRGEVATPASDVYSFGILTYELLTGRPPFEGTAGEVLGAHLCAPPSLPEGLPAGVGTALRGALEKDPLRRPRSACQFVAAIQKAAYRAWRTAQMPWRLGLAALVAVLLFAAGLLVHHTPLATSLENWCGDLRFALTTSRPPDTRILLLSVDDSGPQADGVPLADRADEFGSELGRVFDAGARGVAIDLLLPARWAQSKRFSELVVRHSQALTLAAFSPDESRVIGLDCLSPLTLASLSPTEAASLFGFVNVDEDPDGVTRWGRMAYTDRTERQRSSWAGRVARDFVAPPARLATETRFRIDFTADWRGFERLSWHEVSNALDHSQQLFRDRLVLVGGDYAGSGDDYHRVAARRGSEHAVSGLMLQALMVHTILNGFPVREPSAIPTLAGCAGAVWLCLGFLLCSHRRAAPLLAFVGSSVLYLATVFLAFSTLGRLLPVATPLALWLAGLGIGLVLRARLPKLPDAGRLLP
jgi:CHASE2 domain-containing sensor protein